MPFAGFLSQAVLGTVSSRKDPARPPSHLDLQAASSLYQTSLTLAARTISHANVDATVDRRLAISRELQLWLQGLPPPFPNTLQAARPEEVLVFMQSRYIHHHVGTRRRDDAPSTASPSGVSCALSHLSTLFASLGRQGPYDPLTGLGNPCDSDPVRRFKRGYHRDMWAAGYQESSAVPASLAKIERVVDQLTDTLSPSRSALQNLCTERDALLLLYSWDSAMRGKEGGSLCLADFHDSHRVPLFPTGYQAGLPLPEQVWILPTHGTKTNKRGRAHQDPVHLVRHPEKQSKYCFLTRLWGYLAYSHSHGYPVTHFVFRPLSRDKQGFSDNAFSSSSFNHMYKSHLAECGIYNGETPHGVRRGTLQSTAASSPGGVLTAALQGRIKTPRILDKYLDLGRHSHRYRPV